MDPAKQNYYKLEGTYPWQNNDATPVIFNKRFESRYFTYTQNEFFPLQLKDAGAMNPWRDFVGVSRVMDESRLLFLLENNHDFSKELLILFQRPHKAKAEDAPIDYVSVLVDINAGEMKKYDTPKKIINHTAMLLRSGKLGNHLNRHTYTQSMESTVKMHRYLRTIPTGQ